MRTLVDYVEQGAGLQVEPRLPAELRQVQVAVCIQADRGAIAEAHEHVGVGAGDQPVSFVQESARRRRLAVYLERAGDGELPDAGTRIHGCSGSHTDISRHRAVTLQRLTAGQGQSTRCRIQRRTARDGNESRAGNRTGSAKGQCSLVDERAAVVGICHGERENSADGNTNESHPSLIRAHSCHSWLSLSAFSCLGSSIFRQIT